MDTRIFCQRYRLLFGEDPTSLALRQTILCRTYIMEDSSWKYVENQFDVVTRKSNKRMNAIMVDHQAKLLAQSANPLLTDLSTRTTTRLGGWNDAYTPWMSQRGLYKGATQNVEEKLALLSGTYARQWENKAATVFDYGTADHTAIFPRGREPFQKGTMDLRIAEVTSLATRLGEYDSNLILIALAGDVTTFYENILGFRVAQQGREGKLDKASDDLTEQRIKCYKMLYGNLGLLMDIYQGTPEVVSSYFDLTLLRTAAPDETPVDPILPVPPTP